MQFDVLHAPYLYLSIFYQKEWRVYFSFVISRASRMTFYAHTIYKWIKGEHGRKQEYPAKTSKQKERPSISIHTYMPFSIAF